MSQKSLTERFEKDVERTHDQNRVPIERENFHAFVQTLYRQAPAFFSANELVGAYEQPTDRALEMAGLIRMKEQIEARMVELDREMGGGEPARTIRPCRPSSRSLTFDDS